jgi:hypothetical protein
LQISRRIDWRFLLPDVELGRVGLCGPHDEELARSLTHFGESLTILGGPLDLPTDRVEPVFDLLVYRSGTGTCWEAVCGLLKPGGFLYGEIERSRTSLRRAARGDLPGTRWLASSPGTRRSLERAGFERVQFHWHRPDFRSCREILPLEDPEALRYALRRNAGSRAGQLGVAVARLANELGWLGGLVPCLSVLARKTLDPREDS